MHRKMRRDASGTECRPWSASKGSGGGKEARKVGWGTFKVRAQALSDDGNPSGDFEIQY